MKGMKLATGTRLGPYAIEHAIGAGGMGVVYRADDPRVGRKVAIKILPQAQGEHLKRFEREARTIGGLNHPNLLTLYDVGQYEGMPFLVTEMLDGESLRARLSRGPIRLREAIQIAADVARGLAAAHDAGIIHRDVKPDNIFLTSTGQTKILDFGIAKLRRSTVEMPAVDPGADTPTPTTRDTGVVIGTPGYMAPEQLDAGTVDERSDIFALGVVLYEMICGKRAFASDSPVEESYAILKTTPDPPKGATKSLARVVMRCLEKRKDARFQSAGDLAFALDELDASTDPISRISKVAFDTAANNIPTVRDPQPAGAVATPRRGRWLLAGALAAIACGLGGIVVGQRTAGTRGMLKPSWPSVVEGGAEFRRVTFHTQSQWDARIAPDGKSVLYSATRGGRSEILRSAIGTPSIASTNITGRLLDVSRRGEIAVLTDDQLEAGGTLSRAYEGAGLRPVADHVTDATWLPDDTLAIVRGGLAIEAPIGTPIVKRVAGRFDHLRAAPAGDRLAYAEHVAPADTRGRVVVVDRAGKELYASQPKEEIEGVAWAPDGNEVWFSSGADILALRSDGSEREVLRQTRRFVLIDATPDKILVAPSDLRLKMFTGAIGGPYHEVGWFDSSEVQSVSADGSVMSLIEVNATGQTAEGAAFFVRRADQPATLVGHGDAFTLLPDATGAIAIKGPTHLERISTGVGPPVPIALGAVAQLDISDHPAVSWSGRYAVVRGAEPGGAMKLWRFDLANGGPPEASAAVYVGGKHPITSDGDVIAVARAGGGVALVSMSGKPERDLPGAKGENPLSFTGDGDALFVLDLMGDTLEVDRIDLASGARTTWTRITPEQQPSYYQVALDADGRILTYSTNSDASDLYVLEKP